ncbi:MAG: PQQ-like beta-propeller repeat protein [Lentisphaeraceae bacterium]|nr:PQQ-like beta-propeller repeat protein [Lentisphaeraceae bacterium]
MRRLYTAALACLISTNVSADWPQFLGPDRTGKVTDSKFKQNTKKPKELWSVKVGQGFGGASISGSEAFILDRQDDELDIVKCFDLKSGKLKWENSYKHEGRFGYNGSRSVPAVSDKYVFTMGCMGDVACTDRKSGKMVWKKNIMKEWGAKAENWGFGQSPIVYKDTVIFSPLTNKAGVIALNQATGKEVWKTKDVGSKDGYASPILVNFMNQEMILQLSSDSIAGINPSSGKVIWEWSGYKVKWAIPSPVVVAQDKLFLTGGYEAGSVMIQVSRSGKVKELFRLKETGSQIHAPIFTDGYIYANFNENANLKKREKKQGLTCIDLKGNTKWKTGDKPNLSRGNVILINDTLVALDGDSGELIMSKANSSSYKEISRHKVLTGKGKNVWAPIAYSNGLLVVRDQNEMKCLKLY